MSLRPAPPPNATLTSVPGLQVGHASVEGGQSGCTVILGPFRGVVEVRGVGPGSRELGTLALDHLMPRVDALLLTGGSAFGLAAADGVMLWLEERGRGVPGPAQATTLCVVATDAPLSRVDLARMVRVAGTAMSRRILPVHTPFDGDLTFCVSTAEGEEAISNPELLALGTAGRAALEAAIEGAVRG